ncbi:MAG: hydroxymethylglutaryl-CoA reductase, degradative [Woeseiaceae bacterium]
MSDSRITGFYRLSVAERIDALEDGGWLARGDAENLRQGRFTLLPHTADRMIENVVGVFGLPLGVAPNFTVNDRDYIVPMVVEEPSIVAGVSRAALLARNTGGFTATCDESLLIGQLHVSGIESVDAAIESVAAAKQDLIKQCNAVHPRLAERGGGVTDIDTHLLSLDDGSKVIAVHILVDTRDAMGANLVNTICEAVAPSIGDICKGKVALRILSNLADRSIVTAHATFDLDDEVRDGIVLASRIASADPYRAATHNKGIMNGIDAVAIATGNDWRAIEAGAHAFAAAGGRYAPLATWSVDNNGMLAGAIAIPLKVGTVGGNLDANRGAALGLELAGVQSATELARLMAAVGLAQNFAALHALATSGIQQGHMKLHARSVATSADVPAELFDDVVAGLIESGDVKVWKARELTAGMKDAADSVAADGIAAGKVILLGEHAVVYGKHALALPIPAAVSATLVEEPVAPAIPELEAAIRLIKKQLGVADSPYGVRVVSKLPLAMGLGASAAFAVAIARAYNARHELGLDDDGINAVAYECEKLAHGTPSGIDNTIATFGEAMLFSNEGSLSLEAIDINEAPPIVIACSHQQGRTKKLVAAVRERREQNPAQYDAIFEQIDALSRSGAQALAAGNHDELGRLMNICQGLLNAIGVSTPELEAMIGIARNAGSAGAKLTGAGGGGSIVALCPGAVDDVTTALESAGFRTISVS